MTLSHEQGGREEIRPMEYPVPGGSRLPLIDLEPPENLPKRVRELERALEERERETARQLEDARQEALEQGRMQAGSERAAWRHDRVAQLTAALEQFRVLRDEYLAQVEHEVVRLALAIAERILHREAQMDPMLLSGGVRVALGQLAQSTEVRLRVPAGQKEMWAEMMRLMPGLPLRPEVRGDEGLEEGEAILEASLGVADLGVKAQLGEIERSFFDSQETPVHSQAAEDAAAGQKRG